MDPNSAQVRPLDESLIRELPQLQSLRIAPLRQPVSSRILSVPSPLEPNASGIRESNTVSKGNASSGNAPERLPTLTEFLNAARTKKIESSASVDSLLSFEPPPKPILPAFVNLRALERFPFSSFDDDTHHARKRRRPDVQADSFSEHLQLPIPQAQKEQRPPPFGPFAILNGLNEPPPNAALLPPIEAGSITQLLTKPTRGHVLVEPTLLAANTVPDSQVEKREGRIEDILDSTPDDKVEDGEQIAAEDVITSTVAVRQAEPDRRRTETPEDLLPSPTKEDEDEPPSPKTRGRSRKNLRRWTEEETTDLLRGVVKCGIGNWTAILAQPELKFNKRTASNLKDRFRVCCPWAYRAADPNEATKQLHDTLANALLRAETEGSDGTAGKIRLPQPRPANSGTESNAAGGNAALALSNEPPTPEVDEKNSKARTKVPPSFKATPTLSNRSQSTLASLGIPEPHFTMKSRRRSRRPFTVVEDEALLKGYAVHGFQWTLIQQDKRLNLGHRKATDLRDRFRTKFPHAYRDGGSVSANTLHNNPKSPTSTDERKPAAADSGQSSPPAKQPASISHNNSKYDSTDQTSLGPIDPALSPPAPPQGLLEASASGPPTTTPVFQFPLDENAAGASSADGSWEDNTLAPMVWDELA